MAHVGHCVDLVLDLVGIKLDVMLSCMLKHSRNDGVEFCFVLRRYDEIVCYDVDALDVAERLLVPLCMTSLADEIPNGIRMNRLRPHGVWNVHR